MEFSSSTAKELNTFILLIKSKTHSNWLKNKQGVNEKTLLTFVKSSTWQENVEIEKVDCNGSVVKFSNVSTDVEEVIEQLQSRTYFGIPLDVEQMKKLKKLHLGNLKPDVTIVEICLYLEQPKFQPLKAAENYKVEVQHIDRTMKFALVQLPAEADISLYLDATHSDELGKGLQISEHKRRHARRKTKVQDERQQTSSALVTTPVTQWISIDEIDGEKCRLTKYLQADLIKPQEGKVHVDVELHKIRVENCDAAKLQEVVCNLEKKISFMASTFLLLPSDFVLTINSSKGSSFVKKMLDSEKLRAVYYFNPETNRGMILGENKKVAESAAKTLKNKFSQYLFANTLVIEDDCVAQEWKKFCSSITKDRLVRVFIAEANKKAGEPHVKKVIMQGFKSDREFHKAKARIAKKLEDMGSKRFKSDDKKSKLVPGVKCRESVASKSHSTTASTVGVNTELPSNLRTPSNQLTTTYSVKMSPLVYKFFKTHLSDMVLKGKCKYLMPEQNLVVNGEKEKLLPISSYVESIMTTMVEKQVTIKITGISEGFFNEKNSELRSKVVKFELDHKLSININTSKDKDTILNYAFQRQNQKANKFPDMIIELLMNFSKEKSIRCSDMFSNIGVPKGVVTEKLRDSILKIEHGHVKVKFDNQSDAVQLQGREKFFAVVEKALIGLFKEHLTNDQPQKLSTNQKKIEMNLKMRTENLSDFLRAFGLEDVFAPDHWSKFTGNLRHVAGDKVHTVLLHPNSYTHKYVQDLIYSTWAKVPEVIGLDGTLIKNRNIEVVNIYSVENVFQYKRYMTRLKEFCLQNGGNGFSRLDSSIIGPVLTKDAAMKSCLQNLLWEVNEYHLFHGTRPESRQAIIDQGLDSRLGSRHALFGQGIYFAESSTKADQYADPRENRITPGDSLYMFVARVFMGRMHKAKKPEPYIRPPCTVAQCSSDKCSIHPLNESVLGTHTTSHSLTYYNYLRTRMRVLKNEIPSSFSTSSSNELERIKEQLESVKPLMFRDFVVHDPAQCFPEFLIEYKRL